MSTGPETILLNCKSLKSTGTMDAAPRPQQCNSLVCRLIPQAWWYPMDMELNCVSNSLGLSCTNFSPLSPQHLNLPPFPSNGCFSMAHVDPFDVRTLSIFILSFGVDIHFKHR